MARKIEVQIVGDASSLRRAVGDAEGATGRLGGAFGGMAKAAVIAGGAAGLGAIALGAKSAISSASDLGESVNAINVTFGKAGPQVTKFTANAAKLGLSARAANEALVPVGAGLINAGLSADQAAKSSVALTKRAADMASVFNTSLDDALTAIQAGLRGEADPLERFGVGLSAAAVNAKAMALGLAENEKALTTQDKATARVALIMEQTNRVQGDFKNTSDGLANSQRILSAELENASAKLGQELTPVAAKAAGALASAIPHVFAFAEGLMDRLRPAAEAVGDFIANNLVPVFRDQLIPIWQQRLLPILLQVKDMFVLMVQRVGAVLEEHRAELVDIWKNVAASVQSMWQIVGPLLKFAFTEVLPVVLEVAIVALAKLSGAIRAITAAAAFVAQTIGPYVADIKNAFAGIATFVKEKIDAIVKFFKDMPGDIAGAVSAGAGKVKDAVIGLFDKLPGFVKDALGIKSPSTVFAEIGENIVMGAIKGIRSKAGDLVEAAWDAFGGVADRVGGFVGGLFGGGGGGGGLSPRVQAALEYARAHGWQGSVTSGFRTYAEQAALYARYLAGGPLAAKPGTSSHESGQAVDVTDYNTFGAIMARAPAGIRLYNRLGAVDPVHFSVSGYASGGIFRSPTLGVIGEKGAEAVIPLDQMGTLGEWEVIPGGFTDRDVVSNQTMRDVGALIGETTVGAASAETQTIGGLLVIVIDTLKAGFQAVVDAIGAINISTGGGGITGGGGGQLDWTLPGFGDESLGPIGGMGTGGSASMSLSDFVNAGGFFTSATTSSPSVSGWPLPIRNVTVNNYATITSERQFEDMVRGVFNDVEQRQGFS